MLSALPQDLADAEAAFAPAIRPKTEPFVSPLPPGDGSANAIRSPVGL